MRGLIGVGTFVKKRGFDARGGIGVERVDGFLSVSGLDRGSAKASSIARAWSYWGNRAGWFAALCRRPHCAQRPLRLRVQYRAYSRRQRVVLAP